MEGWDEEEPEVIRARRVPTRERGEQQVGRGRGRRRHGVVVRDSVEGLEGRIVESMCCEEIIEVSESSRLSSRSCLRSSVSS